MNKAQLVMTDLLFVTTILILFFTVSIYMWNISITRIQLKENLENLEADALAISDQLIRTPGLPENWEESITREYVADSYTIGLWHMNEGSGDDIGDSSIYANTGTRYGASWKSSEDCMFNSCLEFDGDDYVNISHGTQYNSQNFSIELWVYPELITDGSERVIIHKNNQWRVKLLSDMRIDFYVDGVGNWQTTVPVSSTKWTNIAFAVEKTITVTVSIYFNGERIFYQTGISGTPNFSGNPIEVGKPPAGISWYEGKIDGIRISNVSRAVFKTFDPSSFGLVSVSHILDPKKVSTFVNLDYDYVKRLFGGYNFNFTLTNATDDVIIDNGKELKLGVSPDSGQVVGVKRAVLYKNEIAFMNLMVWK